ncbi:YhcN/YlaJ family sporulation lipoprotein [Bacillus massiliglaciei]|uniref:YhcN/YlaJ family sporulation lipoprotein n=1 Tax=Bacillus massiliglaciei TaxID=1816693 RepID=UPI000DA6343A|nr:YhcN/YlaJ family sporulation lipoprotein [Bacillus massiliglaciei]
MKNRWVWPFCTVLLMGAGGCSSNGGQAGESPQMIHEDAYSTEKDQLVRQLNAGSPVPSLMEERDGELRREYSRSDRNYHGHESKPLTAKSSYFTAYDGQLADSIMRKVNSLNGVADSRTLITDDAVLITVLLKEYGQPERAKEVREQARRRISGLTEGRDLYVTVDQGVYNRVMVLDNNLRDGGPTDLVLRDTADLFDSLDIHKNHLQ